MFMKEPGQNLVERSSNVSVINKELITLHKNNNKVLVYRNFTNNLLSWSNFLDIFKLANKEDGVRFVSFGTCTIDQSEKYTDLFNNIIDQLSKLHPGKKISVLSIIHFITRNENIINDNIGKIFKEHFISVNPYEMPSVLPPKEAFEPTIHFDPVDGFFIQFEGSTLWKIYDNENNEEYVLNSGDLIFIPKNLKHSVESLCPRNAISISFSD